MWQYILIAALGVLCIALAIALFVSVRALRKYKGGSSELARPVQIIDGVRYSTDAAITKNGEVNVSHREGDVLLEAGKTYIARKDGALLPGQYTLLSAGDAAHTFKLRTGGYVRDYSHGDTLILAEGDSICAVSCNVILR